VPPLLQLRRFRTADALFLFDCRTVFFPPEMVESSRRFPRSRWGAASLRTFKRLGSRAHPHGGIWLDGRGPFFPYWSNEQQTIFVWALSGWPACNEPDLLEAYLLSLFFFF